MPSFDIVSEVENQEARNAVDNANREVETRFDFRGVEASFEWKDDATVVKADGDFHLEQMIDILRAKIVKRGIDPQTMNIGKLDHTGKTYQRTVGFKNGIETDVAKKIVKMIKESKAKVQIAIQGDQVRVTGKKRDDLQAAMQLVREGEFGQPFQFKNFRD